MRAKSWSSYYESIRDKCPWAMYAWSEGKSLHVPFKSFNHIIQNEQILEPMKMWSIVYEYVGEKEQGSTWCEERNEHQGAIRYFFASNEEIPVPVIIQHRLDILTLAREGKLDTLPNNHINPDRFIDRIEE